MTPRRSPVPPRHRGYTAQNKQRRSGFDDIACLLCFLLCPGVNTHGFSRHPLLTELAFPYLPGNIFH